jgi:hypothetical protein
MHILDDSTEVADAMYGLYYGLLQAVGCGTKKTSEQDESKKELQDEDLSITWPAEDDLESGNIFEFELESHGLHQGEMEHTKKSRTF